MAMTTYLQLVDRDEIQSLLDDPSSINQLDQPEEHCHTTQLQQTICYFLCGDAYPVAEEHPVAVAVIGLDNVATSTLENEYFSIVPPELADELVELLAEIDHDALATRIAKEDLQELVDEEELYDLEPWLFEEDFTGTLIQEIRALTTFYELAAERDAGVAIYTA